MTIKETVAARMVANRAKMDRALESAHFWRTMAESHAAEDAACLAWNSADEVQGYAHVPDLGQVRSDFDDVD